MSPCTRSLYRDMENTEDSFSCNLRGKKIKWTSVSTILLQRKVTQAEIEKITQVKIEKNNPGKNRKKNNPGKNRKQCRQTQGSEIFFNETETEMKPNVLEKI